jgi:phosphoglycolate phosphatase
VDALAGLRRLGLSLAVVTNKPYAATIGILEALNLHTYSTRSSGATPFPSASCIRLRSLQR